MGRIVAITGPSFSGKSTLAHLLGHRGFGRVLASLTPGADGNTADGIDHRVMQARDFNNLVAAGQMVIAINMGAQSFGVSAKEIEAAQLESENVVIVCEPAGIRQLDAWCKQRSEISLTRVFLDNPSQFINQRFLERATEEIMRSRMAGASVQNRVLKHYAELMKVMATTENEWRNQAYFQVDEDSAGGSFRFDYVISRFDTFNAKEIADQIAKGLPAFC
ncbi:hypothetical protein [Duganella sp. FT27W]|uniref:hypothetical protein n=1 Tax=Duganella sp. FT27W TaxID=2654636 RepID=UPI00128C26F0|nr:hypothetical protein [Duganella sp. FT27W]